MTEPRKLGDAPPEPVTEFDVGELTWAEAIAVEEETGVTVTDFLSGARSARTAAVMLWLLACRNGSSDSFATYIARPITADTPPASVGKGRAPRAPRKPTV